ncbi:hypothetical protein C5167_011318 [Papaver somniferum]|uniref:Uncharacterized protein n=1 Tax=Papaver somniferum TaxID=3469 RepID=A0A4Y7K6J8_PAPSO|nr:hypothetical protein C5167_011318 [Papaver somniferum]
MEKRVVMAESMLEGTLQYQSGQAKCSNPSRHLGVMKREQPVRLEHLLIPDLEGCYPRYDATGIEGKPFWYVDDPDLVVLRQSNM